jgi:hypothetical protein
MQPALRQLSLKKYENILNTTQTPQGSTLDLIQKIKNEPDVIKTYPPQILDALKASLLKAKDADGIKGDSTLMGYFDNLIDNLDGIKKSNQLDASKLSKEAENLDITKKVDDLWNKILKETDDKGELIYEKAFSFWAKLRRKFGLGGSFAEFEKTFKEALGKYDLDDLTTLNNDYITKLGELNKKAEASGNASVIKQVGDAGNKANDALEKQKFLGINKIYRFTTLIVVTSVITAILSYTNIIDVGLAWENFVNFIQDLAPNDMVKPTEERFPDCLIYIGGYENLTSEEVTQLGKSGIGCALAYPPGEPENGATELKYYKAGQEQDEVTKEMVSVPAYFTFIFKGVLYKAIVGGGGPTKIEDIYKKNDVENEDELNKSVTTTYTNDLKGFIEWAKTKTNREDELKTIEFDNNAGYYLIGQPYVHNGKTFEPKK